MLRGGSYEIYRGSPYQRGYGLGGTFRRFFSWLVPIFKEQALPVIKSGLREIGKTAVITTADIAKDAVNGRDFKSAFRDHVTTGIDNLREKAEKTFTGGGRGRKRKSSTGIKRSGSKLKNYIILKKRKELKDIFSKNESL